MNEIIINEAKSTLCSLDEVFFCVKCSVDEHDDKLVDKPMQDRDKTNIVIKYSLYENFKFEIGWLSHHLRSDEKNQEL